MTRKIGPCMVAAILMMGGCGNPPSTPGDRCATNADCADEQICFGRVCQDRGGVSDAGAPPVGDAGAGVDTGQPARDTGSTGRDAGTAADRGSAPQDAGAATACETEQDCPYTHYCNRTDRQCAPLPPGICREDRSCVGTCNVPDGRTVGRCVDCQSDADCADQAPRTRCLNSQCRLPEGQCENNADCANGESCVDGACQGGGGGGGGCTDNADCPGGGLCFAGQCIDGGGGGGGGGLPGECASHADCAATQQCMQNICLPRCNESPWDRLCSLPQVPGLPDLCVICSTAQLTCDMQSGLCQ